MVFWSHGKKLLLQRMEDLNLAINDVTWNVETAGAFVIGDRVDVRR